MSLALPGKLARANRRNLRQLETINIVSTTTLQVDEVVFPDGTTVSSSGASLDTPVTDSVASNTYQYAVSDRGITDALAEVGASSVSVNLTEIANVNVTADGNALTLGTDMLPSSDASWHYVTPLSLELPDQTAGTFPYARSAVPVTDSTYTVYNPAFGSNRYVQVEAEGVYEIEADMYWVMASTTASDKAAEKTIATQIAINRIGLAPSNFTPGASGDPYVNSLVGVGPVSTCFMVGDVRHGSTSVSTVLQCSKGDRVRVRAVGLDLVGTPPAVTSPAGRSSLRIRRISDHFSGHLSFYDTTQGGTPQTVNVYKGLPNGIPFASYTAAAVIGPYLGASEGENLTLTASTANTYVSGARDYYIKTSHTPTNVKVTLRYLSATGTSTFQGQNVQDLVISDTSTTPPTALTGYPAVSDWYEVLSGTLYDGLVRFKCGPGLNAMNIRAGGTTASTLPDAWLEIKFN